LRAGIRRGQRLSIFIEHFQRVTPICVRLDELVIGGGAELFWLGCMTWGP
jgi:hypothetical protein